MMGAAYRQINPSMLLSILFALALFGCSYSYLVSDVSSYPVSFLSLLGSGAPRSRGVLITASQQTQLDQDWPRRARLTKAKEILILKSIQKLKKEI